MPRIDIKPLSVNKSWRGRRFKTGDYTQYERDLGYLLPRLNIPTGKLQLEIEWGFSSKASDIDNPLKPFLDILQKKYGINDKQIYQLIVSKKDVEKGKDYIDFNLTEYREK